MADNKPDLENLQRRRSNEQRNLTARINRLNVYAGHLCQDKLSGELAGLRSDYGVFVDACNEYIEELGQIDPTDDNCELSDALAKRDAIVQRYRETMEILWFKDAARDIDAHVTEFNSAFDQVEALGRKNVVPWNQQEAERRTLDRKLHKLRDAVYAWRDYRPHGKEKWTLLLRLEKKKEELMDEWACRRDNKRNDEGSSERSEEEEDKGSKHTIFTRPVTHASTTPPVHPHSAIRQGTMETGCPPQQPQQPSHGPTVSFARPPTLTSTPRPPRLHTAPANSSMGQESTVHASNFGADSSFAQTTVTFMPVSLPKFSGESRDYWPWKAEWESIQAQLDPAVPREIKKLQLLESISEPVKNDLRLWYCKDVSGVFRKLEDCYGDKALTAEEIILELQSRPIVKDHQPREMLELILAIERGVMDLKYLGWEKALNDPILMWSLEHSLPDRMQSLFQECGSKEDALPGTRIERLLLFLQSQRPMLRRKASLKPNQSSKPNPTHTPESPNYREKPADWRRERKLFTRATASKVIAPTGDHHQKPCAMCGEEGHELFRCETFRKASPSERKTQVEKAKVCKKCLGDHRVDSTCTPRFLCKNERCKKDDVPADHHYFLCPKGATKKGKPCGATEEQEAALAQLGLTPRQLEDVCKLFTNKAAVRVCSGRDPLEPDELPEYPVLMMLVHVTTKRGDSIGALIDLASDTNYITHQAAERLGLTGKPVSIALHGVNTFKEIVPTKRYLLTIRVGTSRGTMRLHRMACYGLDTIAKVGQVVTSEGLEQFFPGVEPGELARPESIDLLVSARESPLYPDKLQRVGALVLWDGPLGKTTQLPHGVPSSLLPPLTGAFFQSKV
ncbi:uncharacterized protein LOC131455935 isoform X2 [Solea solea]|uniref:uncharacterized protein LOC131455935 isoform X2 n=1 Tax=Solea solea TaxID=90069 RepID=UPI00272A3517|nr:uncharacterized protein LOC131455935 isoform X2 [Solea solea]